MSTTRRPVSASGGENVAADTELPNIELSSPAGQASKDVSDAKISRSSVLIDYDDEKVRGHWKKIMNRQHVELETDILAITRPRAKLDPIAKSALDTLFIELIKGDAQFKEGESAKLVTPGGLEKQVRTYITEKGLASEVKKVTDRLNVRRITDGKRWVLVTTYVFLLSKLFQEKIHEIEELMKDDLGVTEKIILELEAEGGPLDVFAKSIVKSVMEHNRIKKSRTLLELVSQQVRSAI